MKKKRNCIIRSFSLQPSELPLIDRAKARVERHAPDANFSEVVRLALHLLSIANDDFLKRAATLLDRLEPGRPPTLVPYDTRGSWNAYEDELLGNPVEEHRRLVLFEEWDKLQRGPRGDAAIEARIEELCDYFGMIYKKPP